MEEKQKLLTAGALPSDGNDLPKPKEREHVRFWEVMTGNVAGGLGPRQVCCTSLEMGPCEIAGKAFWKLMQVGELEL